MSPCVEPSALKQLSNTGIVIKGSIGAIAAWEQQCQHDRDHSDSGQESMRPLARGPCARPRCRRLAGLIATVLLVIAAVVARIAARSVGQVLAGEPRGRLLAGRSGARLNLAPLVAQAAMNRTSDRAAPAARKQHQYGTTQRRRRQTACARADSESRLCKRGQHAAARCPARSAEKATHVKPQHC